MPITAGLILLLGGALRFTGLNWDEYQHLHPDERFMTMVETGIQMPSSIGEYFDSGNSPLNPYNRNFGTFVYGTYPLFLVKLVGVTLAPLGRPVAEHLMSEPGPNDFGAYATLYRLLMDPGGYESINILGRGISGLFDLLTVLMILLIGRRLYGTRVGVLAAFFLAFSVFDIQQSHFFTVDNFANFPLLLAVWFALDIAEGRGWRSFILAGAFFGLTLAARINLATFAAIIALAGGLRLIKLLENRGVGRAESPLLPSLRTFSFASESFVRNGDQDVTKDGPAQDRYGTEAEESKGATRSGGQGPLSLELQSKARITAAPPESPAPIDPTIRPLPLAGMDLVDAAISTRTVRLGPISLELQSIRRSPTIAIESDVVTAPQVRAGLTWWWPLKNVAIGLVLAALASFLVFRVAQPYAFAGLGLNPKWVQDILGLKDILSGVADYPPSHQWTNRADYLFPLQNIIFWGLGLPLGLAGVFGFLLAGFELAFKRDWRHTLIFFWVGGTFLYQGQQFVKTMRYSLPLYPFLALLAAYFLVWLWDRASFEPLLAGLSNRMHSTTLKRLVTILPRLLAGTLVLVTAAYTLFWAVAFTSIYTRPVSRIAASHWMIHNIPPGSTLGNEHWDDPLPLRVEGIDPFTSLFKGVSTSSDGLLDMYSEDTPEKRTQMVSWLDATDYIVLSSNRLYLSIPRLPLRYPMTTKYYQALFDGSLGFELVETFTSYPQFLGVTINDDNAEEAFTVYDHPKVLIFKKTSAYSHDKFAAMLDRIDLSQVYRQTPINYTMSHGAYQLQPQDKVDDYAGGTWSEIFDPKDLVNQVPVVVWLVLLEAVGVIAFPFTFAAFRSFADRGYAFAKAIGILVLGWGAWTLGSYHILGFSRESISIVLVGLIILALLAAWRQWHQIFEYLRANTAVLVIEELVFFSFFFAFLLIRFGNPDLWHPYFGGEKPMDFAYLNAVIKTTWFPPYNPWFEGGYINYYYFGQVISATLVRLTGIIPEVAYNLLIPMFFALTSLGAFGVASNLVAGIESRSRVSHGGESGPKTVLSRRGVAAGLLAVVFVAVIGNLGEVGVLGDGLMKLGTPAQGAISGLGGVLALLSGTIAWLIDRQVLPVAIGNWYWTATRVIPDTINEFPFFTFLYADLHAHLMGLAYTLVALGAALHAVIIRGRFRWYDLGLFALVLGALRAINTWDYPTYLAMIGGAMVIGFFAERSLPGEPLPGLSERLRRYLAFGIVAFIQIMLVVIPTNAAGVKVTEDMIAYGLLLTFGLILGWIVIGTGFDPGRLTRVLGWRFMALIVLSVVLYFPFMANYGTAYTSVELWTDQRTSLSDYLVVHGIFIFLVASFLIVENVRSRFRSTSPASTADAGPLSWFGEWVVYALPGLVVFEVLLVLSGLYVFAFVLPLVLLAAMLLLRGDTDPERRFISLLMLAGLAMTLVVEIITLKGDIGRMNTVFKFYLQGWVLFAVSGAAGLALIFERMLPDKAIEMAGRGSGAGAVASPARQLKQIWWAALGMLLVAGILYPVLATWAKVNDRFVADSPASLNGLDYMRDATYSVNGKDLALVQDYDAIQWLRENVKGSPVVAEASYELYRWNDRVSINTGLPTIVGWDWHTKQQYSLIDGGIIEQRKQDVADLYNSADPTVAMQLVRRYDVSYIYVGPLESALYDAQGLSKFDAMAAASLLNKVYDANGVQIYQVSSSAQALNR
jgi:YYY domain-containing protein